MPYEISVLGDRFLFFSLPSESEIPKAVPGGKRCVILLPSLDADFRIVGYEKCGKPLCDYYSAAVCAAAHLTKIRGLPLPEISFETPRGILEIICTDDGFFSVNVDKCKVLLSKNITICDCYTDVADIDVHATCRVMRLCDAARFDKKALKRLSSALLPLPHSVVLSSFDRDTLHVRTYTDYNPTPPSSILMYAAAAYNEWFFSNCKISGKIFSFEKLSFCTVSYSAVCMTVKPNFVTKKIIYSDGIV